MKLSAHAHDLLQVFAQPGCPVCRLVDDSVHHHLSSLLYEYVNKVPTHEAIRAARGFCPTHAWHIQDRFPASALGVAILYEGMIRHMLEDMGEVKPDSGRRQIAQAAKALDARADCPACIHRTRIEEALLRNLLEHLAQDEYASAFRQSAGLCLPHLRQAAALPGSASHKAILMAAQQAIWSKMRADLAEYVRLNDYRFAEEEMGDAGDSARRALASFSGGKGVR